MRSAKRESEGFPYVCQGFAASVAGEITGSKTRRGNPKCSNFVLLHRLAQEDVSPCHRAIAVKHFQNGSTKPLIYEASLSVLVGRIILGNSIDDLEKSLFQGILGASRVSRLRDSTSTCGSARPHFTESRFRSLFHGQKES